jgi:predicted phage terminase large subunit-like protein
LSTKYVDWYKTTIPPTYDLPKHIRFLCSVVQDVIDGKLKRVAISTPPGHAKSDTITRRLPNYWGPRKPKDAIVMTGYSQRFADKNLSYPARELARELGILANATAMDEWEFIGGARLIARGVGSAPTGINPISLLIADDPIKDRAQAQSEIERENQWQWWTGSIVQRFWPETRAIVIATRWHEDDLIGRLKATNDGTWTFINLPAIAEEDDVLGRKPGEALWPEKKPIEFLEEQRRAMGDYDFEALFQGNPTPREGARFKVSMIEIVDAIPAGLKKARAWDMGASLDGDLSSGGKMEGPDQDGIYYITDVVRGQWEPSERNRVIRQTAELDGKEVRIRGPQDPGAAGKESAQTFVRLLAGFNVHTEPVSGDKELRADPLVAQVNAGNVKMLRGDWNRPVLEVLRQFPNGKHDDDVDALADAFADLAKPAQSMSLISI